MPKYINTLDKMEFEEVAPVIHAEWMENEMTGCIGCSNCMNEFEGMDYLDDYLSNKLNYCPICGAKMDKKKGIKKNDG